MRLIIRWSPPDWHFPSFGPAASLNRLRCALLGHDDEIVAGDGMMALRCRTCARRSAGWQLDFRVRQRTRARGAADRAPLEPITLRERTTV